MKDLKKTLITSAIVLVALIILLAIFPPDITEIYDDEGEFLGLNYGFWAILPPVIAISLALITKEVYPSLFIGIVSGVLIYSKLDISVFLQKLTYSVADDSGAFYSTVTDPGNISIIVFLVVLGALVCLMRYSGASRAFGDWARVKIKKRSGAGLSTMLLGLIIFVDDYFNCLTVGSVMTPVTDEHRISRAKLAYIIDCTAAPVCIIAPVSSWAAAVSDFTPDGVSGISLFLQAIPYNFYALFTLLMVLLTTILCIDFGKMRQHEINAIRGDLFSGAKANGVETVIEANPRGKILDMVVPIVVLVVVCVFMMLYTGGIMDGESFIDAFSNCSSSTALAVGGTISILIIMMYYCARGLTTGKQCFDSIPEGFKAMFPAIFILIFAWTLNSITGDLGAKFFIRDLMDGSAAELMNLLPAVIFAVALFLAFSTGTSWGTFGILIPIVTAIFVPSDPLYIIGMSACLAGAVCGDHISPVSDTTIMASAGAECDLLTHVNTQIPYALYVAGVSFITFIVAGFVKNSVISLIIGAVLLLAGLMYIKLVVYKGVTPEQEALGAGQSE
ncbi:MAG: Na+/H+ antiporter NhaC family protein [Candidatus Methanomethylophilaceae archaeon]